MALLMFVSLLIFSTIESRLKSSAVIATSVAEEGLDFKVSSNFIFGSVLLLMDSGMRRRHTFRRPSTHGFVRPIQGTGKKESFNFRCHGL